MMNEEDFKITNNEFLRQFETTLNGELAIIEYADQERKIFLTKLRMPKEVEDEETTNKFIEAVLAEIKENTNFRVMPTHPDIAKFMRRNRRKYKDLLPVGINI
ncbi:N-acetyltransferase [Zunongwangia atlantica]|nr:N-acetyltransferase [Zunongwangia atlantica]